MARQHKVLFFERDGETLIVTPQGDSLSVEERVLKQEIDALHKLFDDPSLQNVVVDIGGTPYLGSLILGALIALCKRISDRGGRSALCNASEGMSESLQIMRIDTIIPCFATREEALAAVRE